MKKQFLSKSVPRGTRTIWRYLGALFILFTFAIGNVWADTDYVLIDYSTNPSNPAKTANFINTTSISAFSSSITFTEADESTTTLSHYVAATNKVVSGQAANDGHFVYDLKTTSADVKIYVYNKNNNTKNVYVSLLSECEQVNETIEVKSKKAQIISKSVTCTTGGTRIVISGNTSDVQFAQIIITEKGSAVKSFGEDGYTLDGKRVAVKDKSGYYDGAQIVSSSDVKYMNADICKPTVSSNKPSGFIKFTTPNNAKNVLLTIGHSSSKAVVIDELSALPASTTGYSQLSTAVTETKAKLGPNKTYMIFSINSSPTINTLAFSIPKVSYNANGGSGTMAATEWTVDENGFTAPEGKKFDKWTTSQDGTGTDVVKAVGAEVTENTTLYAQWKADVEEYAITEATSLTGGSVDASAATEAAGETVTITATPAFRYLFGVWDVYKTGDPTTKVSVTETAGVYTFEMPAYPVTVSATFTEDSRRQILYLTTAATGSDKLYAALNADATYNVIVEAPASQTLTNYDLVVLHESLDGKNAASGILHNVATAAVPVLNTKSYFYNNANTDNQRWNWGTPNNGDAAQKVATLNTSYSNIADHPIFDGVTITANTVKVLTDGVTSGNTMQPIGIFTTGKEGYTLATTPNKDDNPTPDGCAIHELTPTQRGVDSGKYLMISVSNAGLNNLTADGQKLFKNAAAYLLDGEAAWVPAAAATDDATLKALSVSGLTLSPAFAAATVDYTVTKAYGADDPAKSDVTATPTADGASAEVAWDETNKKFTITVTAVDNTTTKEYTITVNEAAAPKSLSRVLFSNGFDAFIDNTNRTVKAYYLNGTSEPTATTITAGEGTAGALSEGKIRVTGEDASYIDYIVTLEAVTPNTTTVAAEAEAGAFDGTEAWIKNGLLISGTAAGFNADGKYYVNRRLLKSGDAAEDQRVIAGWVRSYFFVGNASKFIMTVSNNNAIKYSVDGGAQVVNEAASVEITLPAGNHMIEIVSNQSSGDCRLSAPKLVERPATYTVTYTAGEGTGDDVVDAYEYAAGDEVTVQANAFTAPANKKFNGWASPAVTISEGKFEMPASNVVLTAQWKEYFTITYMDGEDVLGTEDVFVGDVPVGIAAPVKAMNIFQGWTLAGSEDLVDVATLTAAKTLYAKWEAIDACFYFAAKSVTEDEAITAPANLDDAFGGTVEATSGTFTYTQYGVLIAGGGDKYFTVNLDYALQEGSKITVKMAAGNSGDRGLNICYEANKDRKDYNGMHWEAAAVAEEKTFEYTLTTDSKLIGKKVFYLYRNNNVYLQTVMVEDCAPQDYTVTYKDGETVLGTEQVFENEHPTADGINTHKKGYEFQGWAETVDGAVVDLDDIIITAVKTMYAQYTVKDCSPMGVKFSMAIDGSKISANQYYPATTPAVGDLAVFATVTGGVAQAVNTSTGTTKNFEVKTTPEFKLSGSNSHMRILLDCPLAENDTIKFTKTERITLSFDSLKTKSENIAKTTSYYIVPTAYAGEDTIHIWYNSNGVSVNGVQVIRPEIYAVSFNLMGHGSAIAPVNVVKGAKIVAPTAPEDDDYAFAGWYKENTLSNEWKFDVDVVEANTTLYAKWLDKSDATLKSLKYGAEEIALEAGVYEYNVDLAPYITEVPALAAVTNNPNATAVPNNAAAFDENGHATSKVVVTPQKDGAATQTYTVNFTVLPDYARVDVTATTEWKFSKALVDNTKNATLSSTETVLANITNIKNHPIDFHSQALSVIGVRVDKSGYMQGGTIKFRTTVPGLLTVEFSNTGNAPRPYRELLVNGNPTGAKSNDQTHVTYNLIMKSGDVELTARIYDENGDPTATLANVNFFMVKFTAASDLDPTKAEESTLGGYERDVTEGRYGTICLPNGGVMVGATIYTLAYYGATSQKIFFDEVVDGTMEAGKPYLFLPNEGVNRIGVFYTDAADAEAQPVNGFVGYIGASEDDYTQVPDGDGNYIVQNNQYREIQAGATAYILSHRAYIHFAGINTTEPAKAPGARRIGISGAPQVATGIEDVQGDNVQCTKMLINGQLFILRGEKMYDATGRLVK